MPSKKEVGAYSNIFRFAGINVRGIGGEVLHAP
jgi:hypothetical protein